jgi:hypothetical protein
MKAVSTALVILLMVVCSSSGSTAIALAQSFAVAGGSGAPTDKGWPRRSVSGSHSFSVYQPQIEAWEGNRFEARAAVSITNGETKQTVYGVIWFSARSEIDKVNRLVIMADFRVTRVNFPTAGEKAQLYQELLQRQVPRGGEVIALDRLIADLAIAQKEAENSGYQLKNDPPRIFFSTRPSILILIDGQPVLRPVGTTSVRRVINTRALILCDASGRFYMHLMHGWVASSAATGPWVIAPTPSAEVEQAARIVADSRQIDLMDGSSKSSNATPSLKAAAATDAVPVIFTCTEPAELLQTQGDPEVAPVEGTRLIYLTNTENDIFIDASTQDHYVLISGRWFRAQSMNGPWEYVAGDELPPEFSRIPSTHPKADVLVSVPGTPQAKEALIANEIPQTATVNRGATSLTIDYDGDPRFRPIEQTSLQYAINTATPVIAVSANRYYAVRNGVWFVASSPLGPWVVATQVPASIYSIPPSSPLHYITYVKVYGSTPEVVYVGYTPGYFGTVVSSTKVVVYGTGWYVPPYVGAYWYGCGWTYGYGAGFSWSTYAGWGVAFGIGYGWSSYYTNTNVYTGTTASGAGGAAYNPNTGRAAVGRAGGVSNAYTGNAAAGARGAHYNPQTGVISAGSVGVMYNASTGQVSAGGRGVAYNTRTDTGVAVGNNNVYAGKDGEVYRYNKSDGLQQHTSSGWSSVSRPADAQRIQNQQSARATGQQRWDNFRSGGQPNIGSGGRGQGGPRGSGGPRFGGFRRR